MRALAGLLVAVAVPVLAAGPTIVIDAGHGGVQAGAASPAGKLEKDVCLQLSLKLKRTLEEKLKATVRLTREKDALVQLQERVSAANKVKPDLFISVHANSMPTQKARLVNEGIETYFLSASSSGEAASKVAARENAEAGGQPKGAGGDTLAFILADLQRSEAHADSSRLAYSLQEALVAGTGAQNRGVQQAPFYVLMGLEAPAVLVEVGFISHPAESKKLLDAGYQQKVADAMAEGVKNFLAQVQVRDSKPAPPSK